MSRFLEGLAAGLAVLLLANPASAEKLGLGRPALPDEIAAWDHDVSPDGTGLPAGSGSVEEGEALFGDYCAICHGDFAEGVDNWPKLAGGEGTLNRKDPLKTVGSYWPHVTTAFDYVNRSMPFGNAQTLTTDEVYAVVAYILYSNDLVEDDFVLSNENLLDIDLPNKDGFVVDDRDANEYRKWSGEPCMANCKDSVEITMKAMVLDVTPEETKARKVQEMIKATNPRASQAAETVVSEAPAAEPAVAAADAPDPALVAKGETVFKKCAACHQVGEGAKNKVGPALNGIVGHPAGAVEGFRYSGPLKKAAEGGLVWDEAALAEFLAKPRDTIKGTKMSFNGLKKDDEIAAVIAYLKSLSQ
ncbi:MAG: c-type cytochrome [Pseudooceanicola sp.]|nr:c-type cytochrome [Pseudooceanicola sp.]